MGKRSRKKVEVAEEEEEQVVVDETPEELPPSEPEVEVEAASDEADAVEEPEGPEGGTQDTPPSDSEAETGRRQRVMRFAKRLMDRASCPPTRARSSERCSPPPTRRRTRLCEWWLASPVLPRRARAQGRPEGADHQLQPGDLVVPQAARARRGRCRRGRCRRPCRLEELPTRRATAAGRRRGSRFVVLLGLFRSRRPERARRPDLKRLQRDLLVRDPDFDALGVGVVQRFLGGLEGELGLVVVLREVGRARGVAGAGWLRGG